MQTEQQAEVRARDEHAAKYAADYRRDKGAWWDELERVMLVEAIRPRPGLRILDAGSGVGRVALELARQSCTVYAVDFSEESLRLLRLRSLSAPVAVQTVIADLARALPFPDSLMDGIISSQVVHHIPYPEARLAAWRELARVAKSQAQLATVVYNAKPRTENEGYFGNGIFFHRYRADELADELEKSGWQPTQIWGWYRIAWRAAFPPIVPKALEGWFARAHIADDRATYLFGQATKKG
jgi:SAM-dependent methyltransferase